MKRPFIPVFEVSATTRLPLPVALFEGETALAAGADEDDEEDDDEDEDDENNDEVFEGGLKVWAEGAFAPLPPTLRP